MGRGKPFEGEGACAMVRMLLDNWDRFGRTAKWIDPDTGKRYVCLHIGRSEIWEEVEIVRFDSRVPPPPSVREVSCGLRSLS